MCVCSSVQDDLRQKKLKGREKKPPKKESHPLWQSKKRKGKKRPPQGHDIKAGILSAQVSVHLWGELVDELLKLLLCLLLRLRLVLLVCDPREQSEVSFVLTIRGKTLCASPPFRIFVLGCSPSSAVSGHIPFFSSHIRLVYLWFWQEILFIYAFMPLIALSVFSP